MPQKCKVCAHSKTHEMEQAYVNGKPKTSIARKHGVPVQSVDYHMDNHLAKKLVRSVQQKEQKHTEGILEGIEGMLDETRGILQQAKSDGHNRLALDAIGQGTRIYELLSKIAVKLQEYQKDEEDKKEGLAQLEASEILRRVLTTKELKAYIQLQGKIASADPDYDMDEQSQFAIDAMNNVQSDVSMNSNIDSQSDSAWNGKGEVRNNQEPGSARARHKSKPDEPEPQFEDLGDGFDLALDDLDLDKPSGDTIPSEKDDPEWLVEERRKRRRHGLDGPM